MVKMLVCVDMGKKRVDVTVCSKRYQGKVVIDVHTTLGAT